jgi:hypothetical protein
MRARLHDRIAVVALLVQQITLKIGKDVLNFCSPSDSSTSFMHSICTTSATFACCNKSSRPALLGSTSLQPQVVPVIP